jgi:hypothetical protein
MATMGLSGTDLALVAMAYLLAKHMLADFALQTRYQYANKGIYGHPGGLLHAGIHAVLTLPVLMIVPVASPTAAAVVLAAAEFLIHYHVDWTKEQVVRRRGWTSAMDPYWWALGIDQLMHHLTYVGFVWWLLRSQ